MSVEKRVVMHVGWVGDCTVGPRVNWGGDTMCVAGKDVSVRDHGIVSSNPIYMQRVRATGSRLCALPPRSAAAPPAGQEGLAALAAPGCSVLS